MYSITIFCVCLLSLILGKSINHKTVHFFSVLLVNKSNLLKFRKLKKIYFSCKVLQYIYLHECLEARQKIGLNVIIYILL